MDTKKDYNVAFSWFAIVGVATFIIAWVAASTIDTAWQFGVNTISEFGIADNDARYYFNIGCLITGALIAFFGLGNIICRKNAGYTVGGFSLIIGGIALALIGVVTMNIGNGTAHDYIAYSAALFIFIAMISFAAGNWVSGKKMFAGVTLIIVVALIAMAYVYDVAELEAYGIILVMIWFLLEAVRMIISSNKG